MVATLVAQKFELVPMLDAFGDNLQSKAVPK
jgi:hypothetical protein